MDLTQSEISAPIALPQSQLSPRVLTPAWVYGWIAVLTAALMAYALTMGFVWDEGFHVVAAQLIAHGKTPYLDFCFPQTPLNAYWNAGWMRLFGEKWRVLHAVAVFQIAAAMVLTAQFLLTRFPVPRWRVSVAIVAVSFIGLHTEVVQFGPIAQAYAAGMLLIVAAFRVAVAWPERDRTLLLAFSSGLLAGGAAGCTMLSAPAALVFFLWFVWKAEGARRFINGAAFVLGVLIPFAPVFVLFAKAPRVVFFNIVQYQAIYRRSDWPGATAHDVDVLSGWLSDGQTLLLGLLSGYAIFYLLKKCDWSAAIRTQFYLAGIAAAALIVYIATAHPTFARYFIVGVPLVSIIAAVGMYALSSRLTDHDQPIWPTAILVALLLLAYGRGLFQERDAATWGEYEEIAKVVHDVTPKNGVIFADELVYFLLKQTPPSGMEFSYSHKVDLSPAECKLYHIVPQKEINDEVAAGRFDTVESCNDDRIDEMHLEQHFAHKKDVKDCSVYWGKRPRGVK